MRSRAVVKTNKLLDRSIDYGSWRVHATKLDAMEILSSPADRRGPIEGVGPLDASGRRNATGRIPKILGMWPLLAATPELESSACRDGCAFNIPAPVIM